MKAKVKYIILLASFAIILVVFLSPMFVIIEKNSAGVNTNVDISTYSVLFNNLPKDAIAVNIFTWISFISLLLAVILIFIQLFLRDKNRPLYYITIVVFTIAFVSFATAGFVYQHLGWAFYLTEIIYALDLIFILSFELISSKGL